MPTKADIWTDDLLDRAYEANLIESFVRGSVEQAHRSPSKGALTLAVDAGYGEGKTFFLRRLKKQLEQSHPVAFVDAWTDDLADDPLTALIATLKSAVEPLIDNGDGQDVRSKLTIVMEKSGTIAKIAGIGLLKRALGTVMTMGAVEASTEVLGSLKKDLADTVRNDLEDSGQEAVNDLAEILVNKKPLSLMEQRVKEFESGREAMTELKDSLKNLVASLGNAGLSAPIVIIIDELDRCRPTYAIKLLEEIKHLFDVAGLVFIFGMHGAALSHSVRAAYGTDFDGAAYLRRFIQRRYRLAHPSHATYIQHLLTMAGISDESFSLNAISAPRFQTRKVPLYQLISEYMTVYSVSARDAHELIGMLETATALSQGHKLLAPLLIPLAIGQMKGLPMGSLPEKTQPFSFSFVFYNGRMEIITYSPDNAASEMLQASQLPWQRLAELDNARNVLQSAVFYTMTGDEKEPLWASCNYPKLLSQVALIRRSEQ